MKPSVVIVGVLVSSLVTLVAAAAPPPTAVTVEAEPEPAVARVHRGGAVEVTLRMHNPTATTQAYRIMTCSWRESWRTDDPQFGVPAVDCDKNVPTTLSLPAHGGQDQRTLSLTALPAASLGIHTIRLGFTAIGAPAATTLWSEPMRIAVVDTATGLALAGANVANGSGRRVVFTVTASAAPVAIADHLALQQLVHGRWVDDTWTSVATARAAAAGSSPVCATIAPGIPLLLTWFATTCWQDVCDASASAEPGQYRLVAVACDGTREWIGAPVTIPPAR